MEKINLCKELRGQKEKLRRLKHFFDEEMAEVRQTGNMDSLKELSVFIIEELDQSREYLESFTLSWRCDLARKIDVNYIGNFFRGVAFAEKDNKYFFVNKDGKEAFPGVFDFVDDFHDGFARVQKDGVYWFMNHCGKPLTSDRFTHVENFKKGYAKVSWWENKNGFIDLTGNAVKEKEMKKN